MNLNVGVGIHRSQCAALPKGWIREEIPRMGASALTGSSSVGRKSDVYYVSPMGRRVRSKPELLKLLGDHYDLTAFDYQTGKINPSLLRNAKSGSGHGASGAPSGGGGKSGSLHHKTGSNGHGAAPGGARSHQNSSASAGYDYARGLRTDASLVPPIRQTASIFKQPVTVHKARSDVASKVKSDKQTTSEKPRQLFWEKRMSGLRASYPDEDFQPFQLPGHFKPTGPGVNADVVLASISTTLHMVSGPIHGQTGGKGKAEENPAVFINPDQPLISATVVSQDDVDKQEMKVNATRAKLAKALEALSA